jgi:hypothetical protein
MIMSCDIAQAVSRRLPTAAAWGRFYVRSCGIFGGRSGNGGDFLRVYPFLIQPTALYSVIIPSLSLYALDTGSVVKEKIHNSYS